MNSGHNCLFHQGFCTVLFVGNEQNAVTLLHSTQRKYEFLVKTKEKPKSQNQITKNKVSLELLHQRLGHRSTRSLMAEDTANVRKYINIRVDPEPLCTSYQTLTTNKKARPKKPLKSKTTLKWMFMDIIPATYSKS